MKKFILLFLLFPTVSFAAPPTRVSSYVANTTILSTAVTANENAIFNYLQAGVDTIADGSVVNADISGSAAIGYSKLSLGSSIVNADISSSAAIGYSKLSLTGAILNADLAGSIADSKLSQITTASKVSGAAITSLSSVPSGAGVLPTANLGSGTANSTSFLRGDQTWTTIAGSDTYSFRAHKSGGNQSGVTDADILFETEDFDSGGNFASSTFTAPVTGKYIFTGNVDGVFSAASNLFTLSLYKNGAQDIPLAGAVSLDNSSHQVVAGSAIVSLTASDTVTLHIARITGAGSVNVRQDGPIASTFTGSKLP